MMTADISDLSPRAKALILKTAGDDAIELLVLLRAYVQMSKGLDIDRKETEATIYDLLSDAWTYGDVEGEQIWQNLGSLQEILIDLREKWVEHYADDESYRDRWAHLNLDLSSRMGAAAFVPENTWKV